MCVHRQCCAGSRHAEDFQPPPSGLSPVQLSDWNLSPHNSFSSGYNGSPPLNQLSEPLISAHTCVRHPEGGWLSVSLFTTVQPLVLCISPRNLDLNVSAAKSNKISSFRPPGLLFLHPNYIILQQIPPGSVLSISSLTGFMDMTFNNILFLPLTD